MSASPADTTRDGFDALIERLSRLLGAAHVAVDPATKRFFAQDVNNRGHEPLAVIAPGTVDELSAAVAAITGAGCAVVPRGGGMSYTDGYLPVRAASVTIDTRRLDRVIEIHAEDRYVVVECGCTWNALNEALAPHGLRTPYWGPLSGLKATVGGTLSQGSVFLGSGLYGPVQESLLGLEVAIADGTIVRIGGAALANGVPFFRHYGPDLSGLFTGDCGALGVKARAALKLIQAPAESRFLSFTFDAAAPLYAVMAETARAGLASECFSFDPGLQAVRMKRVSLVDDVKALGHVVKSAGGMLAGLKEGAKVVMAGRSFLKEGGFSLHFGVDGRDAADADARASAIRAVVGTTGQETDNTVPKVMRSHPFMEVNSMLGPGGERWVPVHCAVPFSQALAMYEACEALFASHAADLERFDVDHGYLSCSVGSSGILVEPCLYWPDARQEFHEQVLDASYLARLPRFPENLAARAFVARLRGELADLFARSGAVSFQIGKFYRYRPSQHGSALALLDALKRDLDPHGLMNPGALGFPA
jgi:FAD/FMN-containing dehydrogenase